MAETQIQPTEAHFGILVDVGRRKVLDRDAGRSGETPYLLVDGEIPACVSRLVWDLEALGWVWRPAADPFWQLTDAGRQALEGSGI